MLSGLLRGAASSLGVAQRGGARHAVNELSTFARVRAEMATRARGGQNQQQVFPALYRGLVQNRSAQIFSATVSSSTTGVRSGFSTNFGSSGRQSVVNGVAQQVRTKCAVSTAEAIKMEVPKPASFSFLQWAKENPFTFGVFVATVKTGVCDIIMQTYSGNETFDWKRFQLFVAFGFAYLGVFQWLIYVSLFGRIFPGMATFANQSLREKLANKHGLKMLAGQVAFDNFVHYTFIYFPVFYMFKEVLQPSEEGKENMRSFWDITSSGLSAYSGNAVQDNLAIWALWVPGDLVVYAVPIWLRLPLNHGISFVWTCILSALRGSNNS